MSLGTETTVRGKNKKDANKTTVTANIPNNQNFKYDFLAGEWPQ